MDRHIKHRLFKIMIANSLGHVLRIQNEEAANVFGKRRFISLVYDHVVQPRSQNVREFPDRFCCLESQLERGVPRTDIRMHPISYGRTVKEKCLKGIDVTCEKLVTPLVGHLGTKPAVVLDAAKNTGIIGPDELQIVRSDRIAVNRLGCCESRECSHQRCDRDCACYVNELPANSFCICTCRQLDCPASIAFATRYTHIGSVTNIRAPDTAFRPRSTMAALDAGVANRTVRISDPP